MDFTTWPSIEISRIARIKLETYTSRDGKYLLKQNSHDTLSNPTSTP